jgi:hypothetical protein
MTLGGLGARRCDLRVMRRLCPTTSIWTVDLAHLLRRFGVDVTFCTITLGANPDFASEVRARPSAWRACQPSLRRSQSFYVDTMEEDGRRVERLFRDAASLGIAIQARARGGARVGVRFSPPMQRRSVCLDELRRLVLSGNYLIIALVDKRKVRRRVRRCSVRALTPRHAQLSSQGARPDLCCGLGSGYTGHYVLVCGYDGGRGDFVVRDPASSRQTLYVPAASFEEARKSFGTDEDLLLVTVRALEDDAEAAVLAELPP